MVMNKSDVGQQLNDLLHHDSLYLYNKTCINASFYGLMGLNLYYCVFYCMVSLTIERKAYV